MPPRFEGKRILITGAAGDIGTAIARRLAGEGALVVLADVALDRVEQGAQAVRQGGGQAWAVRMDVTSPASIAAALDQAEQAAGGPPFGAVTAAGVLKIFDFLDLPKENWDLTLNVNLTGTFLVFQELGRRMVTAGMKGRLVAVSSVSGRSGRPNVVDYAASKAGVINLVRSAALALARHGINVNAVCPGVVDSEMTRVVHQGRAALKGITLEESLAAMLTTIPLGRMQTPADVAAVVAFLLSDDAGYMTGQSLNACGGLEMD